MLNLYGIREDIGENNFLPKHKLPQIIQPPPSPHPFKKRPIFLPISGTPTTKGITVAN